MPKTSKKRSADIDLSDIPELDDEFFRRGVRGKYYERMKAATNIVRIDSDLTRDFPNEATVNEALRLVQQLRQVGKTKSKKKIA